MKAMTVKNEIELIDFTKTINKNKKENVHKFSMEKINEAVIQDISFKTVKRKLAIGEGQMIAIKKSDGEITHSMKA